jgi:hypothetical protein
MENDTNDILEELGISPLDKDLLDDEPPVPVDREKLRSFFDRTLERSEVHHVSLLISNNRAWYDASLEVLEESKPK